MNEFHVCIRQGWWYNTLPGDKNDRPRREILYSQGDVHKELIVGHTYRVNDEYTGTFLGVRIIAKEARGDRLATFYEF